MKSLPRLRFAHLPTVIEEMPRLSRILRGPNILVKRDDQTGLAFGGNKTRKLEFLLAEAKAHGARTLITTGAVQSNHCRQTAAAAARFGFDCILVLVGEQPEAKTANMLLFDLLGAEIVWTQKEEREKDLQHTFQEAWSNGRRPYLVPYGGSSPVGAAAYAYALKEAMEQNQSLDWIVFASSSGGTQAGLVSGAQLFGFNGKILGISIDEKADVLKNRVANLASEVIDRLGETYSFSPDEILVTDAYLGGGYGVMGKAEKDAILQFAKSEGLLLDPVYTGRAGAGLIDLIKQGFFKSGDSVLFWHTGGAPVLFAERYSQLMV